MYAFYHGHRQERLEKASTKQRHLWERELIWGCVAHEAGISEVPLNQEIFYLASVPQGLESALDGSMWRVWDPSVSG